MARIAAVEKSEAARESAWLKKEEGHSRDRASCVAEGTWKKTAGQTGGRRSPARRSSWFVWALRSSCRAVLIWQEEEDGCGGWRRQIICK